jgi:hypothetical protein
MLGHEVGVVQDDGEDIVEVVTEKLSTATALSTAIVAAFINKRRPARRLDSQVICLVPRLLASPLRRRLPR